MTFKCDGCTDQWCEYPACKPVAGQRERFEAWMKSLGSSDANLERWDRNTDQYGSGVAQAAWEGWQASRRTALEDAAKVCDSLEALALEDMALENDERFGVYAKKYRIAARRIRALAASDSNGGKDE